MRFVPFNELFKQAATYQHAGAELLARKDQRAMQHFQHAAQIYRDLLNTAPDNPHVLFLRGTLALQMQEAGLGIALLEKAERFADDVLKKDLLNNLGASYRQNHHNDQARSAYMRALELDPNEPDVLANLCALAVNEGNPANGIAHGERCLELNPTHSQGRWNLALLYLENEEYGKGFALYNQGFETQDRIMRTYIDKRGLDAPMWDGSNPGAGKTIVLWGEQGQGDEMLWLQFVPCVRDLFDRVIIDCHPKLLHMVKRAFPWAHVYPTRKEDPVWSTSERIDYKQSIASLPQWFHGERGKNTPYLKPDPSKVEKIRDMVRYGQKQMGQSGWPVVGMHWMGGRGKTRADLRSVFLPDWKPVMDLPVSLLSLQYTEAAPEEIGPYADRVMHWQAVSAATDYDWPLAALAACDLVISVNTTIVHACGAAGFDCWTMTPVGRAWRYGKNTGRYTMNPFYRTVKEVNQQTGEPWADVMQIVGDDLAQWLEERK